MAQRTPADVAVVIPAYFEGQVIADTVATVLPTFPLVIVVDDGSTDGTSVQAAAAGGRVIRHAVNLGQGGALATGIKAALMLPQVQYIVTYDADGQHRIDDAAAMVERLRVGDIDVALGNRFAGTEVQAGLAKRLLLKAAVVYTRRDTGLDLHDTHNGLRAMTRAFAAGLDIQENGMGHASEILEHIAHTHARYAEVPVTIRYTDYSRAKGQPILNAVNIMFDKLLR